jgi:hypothetical protein
VRYGCSEDCIRIGKQGSTWDDDDTWDDGDTWDNATWDNSYLKWRGSGDL